MKRGIMSFLVEGFFLPRLSGLSTMRLQLDAVIFHMHKVYFQLKLCILMVETCLKPVSHYNGELNKHLLEAVL